MTIGGGAGAGRIRRRVLLASAGVALLAVACGGDDEPELTFEDQLVELEGRSLTPAEVAERVEVGETLCQLDDPILDELWQQLSEEQLAFQDLIIAELCPERAILYAGHTGRFVTEEAEESGVRTSTTRPPPTTTSTSRSTTTRPGSTASPGTGSSVPGSTSSDPSGTSTTATGQTSGSTSQPASTTAATAPTTTTAPTTASSTTTR